VYSGPIGAVVTPLLHEMTQARELPYASSLCGACREVCPVQIDIPRLLLRLRVDLSASDKSSPWERVGLRAWRWLMASSARYRWAGRLARWGSWGLIRRKELGWLPPPFDRWTRSRTFPAPAARPFHARWAARQRRARRGQT
jgi:L-lactate dehydrogenase complex protein LldF